MGAVRTEPFARAGEVLTPGVNVDLVDVGLGMQRAADIGYSDFKAQMVVQYALARHARGEEKGALGTWLAEYPNDLTSWYMILAHASAVS